MGKIALALLAALAVIIGLNVIAMIVGIYELNSHHKGKP